MGTGTGLSADALTAFHKAGKGIGLSAEAVTAFHEAGHAVAAVALGLQMHPDGMNIVPTEDVSGSTKFLIPTGPLVWIWPKSQLRKGATAICAGAVAAWCVSGEEEAGTSAGDIKDLRLLLTVISQDENAADVKHPLYIKLRDRHVIKAITVIKREFRAVELLAAELVKRKTISGSETTEIIRQALVNKKLVKRKTIIGNEAMEIIRQALVNAKGQAA